MPNDAARVRISKVTYKANNVTMLRSEVPNEPSGTTGMFIETLLAVLARARKDQVAGYVVSAILQTDEGWDSLVSIDCPTGDTTMITLGALRRAEHMLLRRTSTGGPLDA